MSDVDATENGTWILIYWLTSDATARGSGSPVVPHMVAGSVEFADERACRKALATMVSAKAHPLGIWGVCVPKSSKASPAP